MFFGKIKTFLCDIVVNFGFVNKEVKEKMIVNNK